MCFPNTQDEVLIYNVRTPTSHLVFVCLSKNSFGVTSTKDGNIIAYAYKKVNTWLGIRDGNITFQDSLDFDISEINSVYDNNEGLAKTIRTY